MAPLPKRKHSTRRSGLRKVTRRVSFPSLVKCAHCGQFKLSHRICPSCKK